MQEIHVDRRTIRGQRDDEGVALLAAGREEWLRRELDLARLLARLDRQGAFQFHAAASVVELAARQGYDRGRARELLHLGYALAGLPELEAALRERQVTMPVAVLLGQLYRDPARYVQAGENWLRRATLTRYDDLRRAVRMRIASRRQEAIEAQVMPMTAYVGPETAEDVEACRTLASQRVGRRLDNGEVVSVLALFYRLHRDPRMIRSRARRMVHTSQCLEKRGVAREVARAIFVRSDGICEVGGCQNVITERCHVEPHRDGSAREEHNLFGACTRHHTIYDAGLLEFVGWTPEGLPAFRVRATGELLSPKPRPEDREAPERPAWLWKAVGRPRPGTTERASGGKPRAREGPGASWPLPPDVVRDRGRPPPTGSRTRRCGRSTTRPR